jgi:hypothetical protein
MAPSTGGADWRATLLEEIRGHIEAAVPDVVEEAKWVKPTNPAGVPTWSHHGILCTGEIYKDKVKVTFAHGAALDDPDGIFNASLDAGTRRAIDIAEGDRLDAAGFRALVRAAADHNATKAAAKAKAKAKP